MRTGGLSITHTNVTDTFQWPGASLLSSTNVRLSAVMSELEIVANGPSSDPVQHFTVLGVQGNNIKISSSEEGFVGWDEEEEMEEDE